MIRKRGDVVVRVRVPAAGVDGHVRGGDVSHEPAGQELVQRQAGDLGRGVPQGQVECAHRPKP